MSGEHLLMMIEASHTKHLRKQAAAVWRSQPGLSAGLSVGKRRKTKVWRGGIIALLCFVVHQEAQPLHSRKMGIHATT